MRRFRSIFNHNTCKTVLKAIPERVGRVELKARDWEPLMA